MARGSLQMAWINKGENAEEHYHLMYGLDGENMTMKARTIRGRKVLTTLLKSDLKVADGNVAGVISDLEAKGTASVEDLDIDVADLRRLDLV